MEGAFLNTSALLHGRIPCGRQGTAAPTIGEGYTAGFVWAAGDYRPYHRGVCTAEPVRAAGDCRPYRRRGNFSPRSPDLHGHIRPALHSAPLQLYTAELERFPLYILYIFYTVDNRPALPSFKSCLKRTNFHLLCASVPL